MGSKIPTLTIRPPAARPGLTTPPDSPGNGLPAKLRSGPAAALPPSPPASPTSFESRLAGVDGPLQALQQRRRSSATSNASAGSASTASSRSSSVSSMSSQPSAFSRTSTSLSGASSTSTSAASRIRRTRLDQLEEAVRGLAGKPTSQTFSAVEDRIAASFVHRDHLKAIAMASRLGHFAVSFREAGESTLRCIGEGAPAKGHDILENTLKGHSLARYGDQAAEKLALAREFAIDGYVGHWEERRLLGLYMHPDVAGYTPERNTKEEMALSARLKFTKDGKPYYPVDLEDRAALQRSLKELTAVVGPAGDKPKWKSLPVTGDYDSHEVLVHAGHWFLAPSESSTEKEALSSVNKAVSVIDPRRPMDAPRSHLLQHGAQSGYVAFTLAKEPDKPVLPSVAGASFPLAMCDCGEWQVIENHAQLEAFYKKKGIALKEAWTEAGKETAVRFGQGAQPSGPPVPLSKGGPGHMGQRAARRNRPAPVATPPLKTPRTR